MPSQYWSTTKKTGAGSRVREISRARARRVRRRVSTAPPSRGAAAKRRATTSGVRCPVVARPRWHCSRSTSMSLSRASHAYFRDAGGICAAVLRADVASADDAGRLATCSAGPPRPTRPSRVQVLARRTPAPSPRGARHRVSTTPSRLDAATPSTRRVNKQPKIPPPARARPRAKPFLKTSKRRFLRLLPILVVVLVVLVVLVVPVRRNLLLLLGRLVQPIRREV